MNYQEAVQFKNKVDSILGKIATVLYVIGVIYILIHVGTIVANFSKVNMEWFYAYAPTAFQHGVDLKSNFFAVNLERLMLMWFCYVWMSITKANPDYIGVAILAMLLGFMYFGNFGDCLALNISLFIGLVVSIIVGFLANIPYNKAIDKINDVKEQARVKVLMDNLNFQKLQLTHVEMNLEFETMRMNTTYSSASTELLKDEILFYERSSTKEPDEDDYDSQEEYETAVLAKETNKKNMLLNGFRYVLDKNLSEKELKEYCQTTRNKTTILLEEIKTKRELAAIARTEAARLEVLESQEALNREQRKLIEEQRDMLRQQRGY